MAANIVAYSQRIGASAPPSPAMFRSLAPRSPSRFAARYSTTRIYEKQVRSSNQPRPVNAPPPSPLVYNSALPSPYNSSRNRRSYYTESDPAAIPYGPAENAILSAALEQVPTLGFTQEALAQGAVDAGYLPASTNLVPRGAFDLVLYYHVTQRLDLKNRVQFPTGVPGPNISPGGTSKPPGVGAKVRALILARLHANAPLIPKYHEALALMSLAGNIPASLAELGRLVDEIWYLAGDISVDSSWYTKRGLLAGVYASAEVFMTQDRSNGFIETEQFVDRRLEDVRRVGGTAGAVGEWIGFTAGSAVNVARSLGVRI